MKEVGVVAGMELEYWFVLFPSLVCSYAVKLFVFSLVVVGTRCRGDPILLVILRRGAFCLRDSFTSSTVSAS